MNEFLVLVALLHIWMGDRPIASCLPRQKMWTEFRTNEIRVRDLQDLARATETAST